MAGAPHGARGDDGPPPGPPPWLNREIQTKVTWRDGDIVVSVPPKSGTTWTMNIVHQLRSGGDGSFADIYAEVPWLEILPHPGADIDAIVARIDGMSTERRRAFKTHAAPPDLPFQKAGAGPDVRYVVVARNPDEAVASFYPFILSHSDAWFDLWGVPKEAVVGPDFDAYFAGLGSHAITPMVFGLIASWWQLRNEPNVLLVHYADLKRKPDESVRAIAEFVGFEPSDAQWPAILEYTSFGWMKAHEDKFELRSVSETPILNPGAMIRKGQIGVSTEDGITPAISATIAEIGRNILTDPAGFDWLYNGGDATG
ncbi:MAG: sulfotransferase domain-containing protein [Acidimicrobiia bacterium]